MAAPTSPPDSNDIVSEFRELDNQYDEPDFYGGAFEGSHYHGDAVLLRLYAIAPGDEGAVLRIETRHHYGGDVLHHDRTERELGDERTVVGFDGSLEEFCRSHHFDSPATELGDLLERVETPSWA